VTTLNDHENAPKHCLPAAPGSAQKFRGDLYVGVSDPDNTCHGFCSKLHKTVANILHPDRVT
jgi:hypothetical protein